MWMAVGIPATAKAPGLISAVSTGMNNIVQTSPQNVGGESAMDTIPHKLETFTSRFTAPGSLLVNQQSPVNK